MDQAGSVKSVDPFFVSAWLSKNRARTHNRDYHYDGALFMLSDWSHEQSAVSLSGVASYRN